MTQPQNADTPAISSRQGLSALEDELLLTVQRYHFVTTEQVVWLLGYKESSYKYVFKRMKRLADSGFLLRLTLPSLTAGNPAWIYTLSTKGGKYLKAAGFDVSGRREPSDHAEHSYLFLTHTLFCNRVLGAAELVAKRHPEVVVARMLHERDLRHMPVKVKLPGGEPVSVINDGFVEVHLAKKHRMAIAFELDRATVDQKALRRKLSALIAFLQGPAQEALDCPAPTIAWATTGGPHRVALLRRWCKELLEEAKRMQDASLFLFTQIPEPLLDADAFYLAPIWLEPGDDRPVPLLEWE